MQDFVSLMDGSAMARHRLFSPCEIRPPGDPSNISQDRLVQRLLPRSDEAPGRDWSDTSAFHIGKKGLAGRSWNPPEETDGVEPGGRSDDSRKRTRVPQRRRVCRQLRDWWRFASGVKVRRGNDAFVVWAVAGTTLNIQW